ncbi:unnamed protein product [Notodromas monacha]|uniref:Uncharacterized protein n=1 Tax=Notodromas monacha TaxID=399045 RepID=A0A7R9BRI5_9CRUS|nr:unnamed protein product [Notodromas monacha]CAG0920374.1 unnamed protein product [Notodromas monacha]
MKYHWESHDYKRAGVDDMVLLTQISDTAVVENLKKRFLDDCIYTYIGPVLVSVNPFKSLPLYDGKNVEKYQGAAQYENPPHVFALTDEMYRDMMIENESQCVIISGESGAGKTVAARHIMNYLTRVSGGGSKAHHLKDVIVESNPLLEAFGNAKTVRNDNSSRFGKYVEISFTVGGAPSGGQVTNFLLEKSRVVHQNPGERNFHIFYQLLRQKNKTLSDRLGLVQLEYFDYMRQSNCFNVDGVDDASEFEETGKAMKVMGLDQSAQFEIFSIVAAVLHLGNIQFFEDGNYVKVSPETAAYPAYLLGVSEDLLRRKLESHVMESKWGATTESTELLHNYEQACYARDALAKELYSRMFNHVVLCVNQALANRNEDQVRIGILDIYGFEVFDSNGFEQFCINYVNEKLQQIFIDLTLKAEQACYARDALAKELYSRMFNHVVLCVNQALANRNEDQVRIGILDIYGFEVFDSNGFEQFCINYVNEKLQQIFIDLTLKAEQEEYHVEGINWTPIEYFNNKIVCELIEGRNPPGLMCILDDICVSMHAVSEGSDENFLKVQYLGLKENVRVRRAGFAYRRPFDKFLRRYSILCPRTWPKWFGEPKEGVKLILTSVGLDSSQCQLGKTKIFIKAPESLFDLEESRQRKFDVYARVIQNAFRNHFAKQRRLVMCTEGAAVLGGRKERRRNSVNRSYVGDYIGVDSKAEMRQFIPRRCRVEFAQRVSKFDRRFNRCDRDLILFSRGIVLIGEEKTAKGPDKGKVATVKKLEARFEDICEVILSPFQDGMVLLRVKNQFDSLLEIPCKTEFLRALSKCYEHSVGGGVPLKFLPEFEFQVKNSGWGGGGLRKVRFERGNGNVAVLKAARKILTVSIGPGLDPATKPNVTMSGRRQLNGNGLVPVRAAPTGPSVNRAMTMRCAPPSRLPPSPPVSAAFGATRSPPVAASASAATSASVLRTSEFDQIKGLADRVNNNNLHGFPVGSLPLTRPSFNGSPPSIAATKANNGKPPSSGVVSCFVSLPSTSSSSSSSSSSPPNKDFPSSPKRLVPKRSPTFSSTYSPNGNNSLPVMNPFGTLNMSELKQAIGSKVNSDGGRMLSSPSSTSKSMSNIGDMQRQTLKPALHPKPKPSPGGGRPKPALQPKPKLPVQIQAPAAPPAASDHQRQRDLLMMAEALYPYDARGDDELSLKVGDRIRIVKRDPSGWWEGILNSKAGLFPGNFVREMTI